MSIFSRVRGRLSSSSQADVDPHEWRLTSYSTSSDSKRTVIPHPRIFANAFVPSDPTLGTAEGRLVYPDISHTAVHLALLECFRKLRLSASGLNVELQKPPTYTEEPKHEKDQVPVHLHESERWDLMIRLAIARFTAWWTNMDEVFHHATAYAHYGGAKTGVQLTKDYLPPLDVLLVWYAFMLDDETYTAACRERDMPVRLVQLCFPWPAIRDVIDMETLTFTLPRAAANLFSTLSSQSPDILTYLEAPPAYSEAPSLPYDLFTEVKRHEKFIDDTHDLLWIRSPSLRGSLDRSSDEYLKLQLSGAMSEVSDALLPFGLALIWRTHKLFPLQYQLFRQGLQVDRATQRTDSKSSFRAAMRAIISDDDGSQSEHPSGITTNAPKCYCWTCERIRDDIPTYTSLPPDQPMSPSTSASAPSSTNPLPLPLLSLTAPQLLQIKDDISFHRAVESARSLNLPLPTRPPTPAERAAEKLETKKREQAGVLPSGLNEYVEVLPDGTRRIRRVRGSIYTRGLGMV